MAFGEHSRAAPESRWASAGAARHYASGRFRSPRAAGRDGVLVARLLRAHSVDPTAARILDVPHGTGRLAPLLDRSARRWIGLDRSAAMLGEARARHRDALVLGSADRLPFADASFDAVICCRLLHHLDERTDLGGVLRELVRVSRRLVVASFWDAGSLQAWRRRAGLRVDRSGRRAIEKRRLEELFRSCGAPIVGYAHGLRGVSLQTFAAALKGP